MNTTGGVGSAHDFASEPGFSSRWFNSAHAGALLYKLLLTLGLLGFACLPLTAHAGNLTGCPSSFEVPAGGSATLDTYQCPFTSGLGTYFPAFYPDNTTTGNDVVNTAHGTATNVSNGDQYLAYQNNGDGATSDTYTWVDANSSTSRHVETISILNISTTSLPNATVGAAYNQTVSGAGGTTSGYSFTSTSLPAGLSLSTAGVLSGTPTTTGSYSFTVTLSDGVVSVARTYSGFTVANAGISISPSSLPGGTVGAAYSQSVSASGGTSPYSYTISAGALPAGLSINPSSGAITGTPTAGGTFSFTVKATDASSNTGTQTYSGFTVAAPTISVSPTTLPGATQNSSYSQTVTASGGTSTYTYAITAGSLPSGLSISSSGVLSGTPSVYGNYNFTITATDSSTGTGPYTGSRAYSLSVTASTPTITTASVANGTVGVSYSQTISASNGNAPYTFSILAGSLPPGLSISSGGVISGTPTAGGSYTFTVKVTDAASNTATRTYTGVTINAPIITVSPSTLPGATQNNSYSQTVTATGGTVPYTYAVTSGVLPSGLTLNANTGALSGTPTVYGNYSFTITATDSSIGTGPYSGTANYTLTVTASTPTITTASVANGTVGVSYSQTISASNGNAPYTFSILAGSLPPGLSISSGGVISGTPTAGGSYTFTVKVTDAASNTATRTYTSVTINAPIITVSPSTMPGATQNSSYSQTVTATGGTVPYTYAVTSGALPSGLAINPNTGALSGTPTVYGNYSFTITATDSSTGTGPFTGSRAYTLVVTASTPVISPTTLPNGSIGTSYSQTISASNGNAPYTFSLNAGSLPPGVTLSSNGTLAGTPTAGGSYSFTVKVTDAASNTATQSYTGVSFSAPTLSMSPASITAASVGAAYSQSFSASGGTAPYTYAESGSLPAGMSWNASTATLSGTPTQAGPFPIVVQVTDSSGGAGPYTHNFNYTVQVNAASLSITPANNTAFTAAYASAYSQSFSGSGGTSPYSFRVSSGSLPAGLSLSSSGVLSGTPTQTGHFSFAVTMTDSSTGTGAPFSTTANYSLTVSNSTITLTPATLGNGAVSANYSAQLSASGGIGPYLFSVTSGALPTGLSLSSSGALSGTPTAAGAFNVTVTATDANSFTGSQAYTLTIAAPTLALSPTAPALPTATAESTYTQSFTASGGTAPYRYAVSSGSLPTGLSLSSTGALSGTPTVSGAYTFSITATDSSTGTGAPFTATRSYSLTINAPTLTITPPTLPNPEQAVAYHQQLSASGGTGSYTYAVTQGSLPAGVVLSSAGLLSGTPTVNGPFSFSVTVTDGDHFTGTQSYSVAVSAPPVPTVSAKAASTPYNSAVSVDLTSSINGLDITAVNIAAQPAHGTVSVSGETVTYTPSSTFYGGTDSFTYTASNPGGTSAPATVTLTVGAPAIPTVGAKSVSTSYNTATSIGLSGVISGVDITAVNIATQPAHGTVSVSGETVTYTPSSTFYGGTDSFTYTATNPGGTSAPATVTLTVGAPAIPTVGAKSVSTSYNTAASIDLSGAISGVDITAVNVVTQPAHGTVSVSGETVTYTPSSTFYGGTDSFTYTATNPGGTSTPATVTLTVGAPAIPTVGAKSVSTSYNTAASIDLSGVISGVDITAVNVATQPAHGTVSVSGETVTYTPSSTFYGGTDSFTYTATNPGGTSTPATVTLTVGAPAIPTVGAKSVSTSYNTAASIDLSGAISGVDITAVNIAAQPTHGTVSVSGETVTYTPSSTFYGGTDSFTYTATNPGGTSTPATVTLTVGAPAIPTVGAKSVSTSYNTAASIDLSGAISGVDITAVNVATQPAHGTVSVSGKTVTYTPSSTFYGGTDSFTYTATNPGGTSTPATVTVTVTPLSVPTAAALSVNTTAGTPVTIQVMTNASGPQPFTGVNVAGAPAHGSASVNGEQIVYTPNAGFVGTDSFTYQISNHFGSATPATVTVTVTKAGSSSGQSMTVSTTPNAAVNINLAQVATGDYVSSTVLAVSPGNAGSTTINPPTSLTFTPSGSYRGLVQITALLTAANGQATTVHVLVLVSSQPDPSKNPDVTGLINAQAMAAQQFAMSQITNIQQRLDALHDGATPMFSNNLTLSIDGQSLGGGRPGAMPGPEANGAINEQRPGMGAAGGFGNVGLFGDGQPSGNLAAGSGNNQTPAKPSPTGLGVWINGQASFGSFDSYRQAAGFDSDNIAVNAGIDQRIGGDALVGMSIGYNHDNSTIGRDNTRSIAQGYSAALYGSFQPASKIYIDGLLGGGGLSFNNRRFDTDTGDYLTGRRAGNMWFGALTGSYVYQHSGLLLAPYGSLKWSYADLNGYSESGPASAALAFGSQTIRNAVAVLGIRGSSVIMLDKGTLLPHAQLEIGYNFQGMSSTTLGYALMPTLGTWNISNSPYGLSGGRAQLGFGVDLQLPHNLILTTDYGYFLQANMHDQMLRFSLNKQF